MLAPLSPQKHQCLIWEPTEQTSVALDFQTTIIYPTADCQPSKIAPEYGASKYRPHLYIYFIPEYSDALRDRLNNAGEEMVNASMMTLGKSPVLNFRYCRKTPGLRVSHGRS